MMFIEALAALDAAPGSLLVWPENSKARSLDSALVRFNDAVRAMAVHVYGHASAALARCVRTAAMHLAARPWLALQLRSKAGSGGSEAGVVQVADMEATRDTLKQVRAGLALLLSSVFWLTSTGRQSSMASHSHTTPDYLLQMPAAALCWWPSVLLHSQEPSTMLFPMLPSLCCAVS